MDWLSRAIRNTWLSPLKVPVNIRGQRPTKEEWGLLGRLREAVFDPQFTRPERSMFTGQLKRKLVQQGPWERKVWRTLVALLSLRLGCDIFKVGKALVDMGDLEQHVS